MKVKIQMTIESDAGEPEWVHEVAQLERGALRTEALGMTLAEAKSILGTLQHTLVEKQASEFLATHRNCSCCSRTLARKGEHELVFRTLFGKLKLVSPRFYHCRCQGNGKASFSPLVELLPERRSPELLYLETRWAALMSYGMTVKLLQDVLPISRDISPTAVLHGVSRLADRLDGGLGEEQACFIEGGPRDWEALPEPAAPLAIGIDGGYVHSRDQTSRQSGWFEVIVGKSIPSEGSGKCFGWVRRCDQKPKRRLFELLKSQGMQMNQAVTFLSDGGDTVRDLQRYLNPQAEHLLDWFHVTMRLTVMGQLVKGLVSGVSSLSSDRDGEVPDSAEIQKSLERIKWNLWHGNVRRALEWVGDLEADLDAIEGPSDTGKKLLRAVSEFGGYITANQSFIPNYGDRYRHGERISTGFVESTVNQVVSKRFVKKQQMRWSEWGVHRLLQIRTQVLNGDWHETLRGWYPGMTPLSGVELAA